MKFKALLSLCRISNLPTVWSNVLCASLLALNQPFYMVVDVVTLLALIVLMSCFYCGGMVMNDICDRDYDRQHQIYRPLISGTATLKQAILLTLSLFSIGLIGLLTIAGFSIWLWGALLFIVICLYNFLHKLHASTIFLMAVARALIFVCSSYCIGSHINSPVIVAAGIQGLYVLILSAVARYENQREHGRFNWPVIPWMICAIALIDGVILSVIVHPAYFFIGIVLMVFTRCCQSYIRGD